MEKATFGAGCFWCAEAAFKLLPGVVSLTPGHAGIVEAVQIEYDPVRLSYEELLRVFWEIHNPTEENRQGPDVGPQYQAVIFFHTEEQRTLAEQSRDRVEESMGQEVATKILPFQGFSVAEERHHGFYERNPDTAYSRAIIAPKVEKVKKLLEKEHEE